MDMMQLQNILDFTNIGLEGLCAIFITFVFFDLVFTDKNAELSGISEKFEKFKRYDVFKSSLLFLVFSIYFGLFGKFAVFLNFPRIAFSVFALISNLFIIVFVFKLYTLIHKYVPKIEKN